jgi:hypothetical protein
MAEDNGPAAKELSGMSIVGSDEIISPGGTRMVYVSQGRLFTRRLDQPNATELAGTQGAWAPFFSPDGQWVAFFAPGRLQKISVEGGSAITLCNAPNGRGGSWGEDGNIIAALNSNGGLSRIPSAGGPPTPVTDCRRRKQAPLPQSAGRQGCIVRGQYGGGADDASNIDVLSLADHRNLAWRHVRAIRPVPSSTSTGARCLRSPTWVGRRHGRLPPSSIGSATT